MDTELRNSILLQKLSNYLNNYSDFITADMVGKISKDYDLDTNTSYQILLSQALDLDRELEHDLREIVKPLDINKYTNNPYYKNIKLDNVTHNDWQFQLMKYKPYEAFVYNDLVVKNGKVYPQIGYFDTEYFYPAILQNGREWMLITPNEIETMNEPINNAHGKVLTYGLGLGYFAYMASNKPNVNSVTIVEMDKSVIDLFNKYILPQFPHKEKIIIINANAIEYAKDNSDNIDYVFADIWHDPSDAIDIYCQLKQCEKPNTQYDYWIEKTIKYYLGQTN